MRLGSKYLVSPMSTWELKVLSSNLNKPEIRLGPGTKEGLSSDWRVKEEGQFLYVKEE